MGPKQQNFICEDSSSSSESEEEIEEEEEDEPSLKIYDDKIAELT